MFPTTFISPRSTCIAAARRAGLRERGARWRRLIAPFVLTALVWRVLFGDCVQAANLARLDVRVLSGHGVIHQPSQPSAQRLMVEVVDQDANPVAGAMVTFQLPERGPGGTFSNGMKTDVVSTGPDGRAWAGWMQLGRDTGAFQVEVTARKSGLRATTVVRQEVGVHQVSDAEPEQPDDGVKITRRDPNARIDSGGSGSKKWMWIALLAGGAVSGLALGMAGGKSGAKASSPLATAAPNTPGSPMVGSPQITVGKP